MPKTFRRVALRASQREALPRLAIAHRDDDTAALRKAVAGGDPVLRLVALRALPYGRIAGGWGGLADRWSSPRRADLAGLVAAIPLAAEALTVADEDTAGAARHLLILLANQRVDTAAAARAYEALVVDAARAGGVQPVQALVHTHGDRTSLDPRVRDVVRAEILRIVKSGRAHWNVERLVHMLGDPEVLADLRKRWGPGGGFSWLMILAQERHPDAPKLILAEMEAGLSRRDLAMHAATKMPSEAQLPHVEAVLEGVFASSDAGVALDVLRGVGGPKAAEVARRFFDRVLVDRRDGEATLLHDAARVLLDVAPAEARRLTTVARALPPQRRLAVTAALAQAGVAPSLPKLAADLVRSQGPSTMPRFGEQALGWAYRHAPQGPARDLLLKRLDAVSPAKAPKLWASSRLFESAPVALLLAIRRHAPGHDEAIEARLLAWLAATTVEQSFARQLLAQALGAVGGPRTVAALTPRCRFPQGSGLSPVERLWMRAAVGAIEARLP